jgi:hypothetical protein
MRCCAVVLTAFAGPRGAPAQRVAVRELQAGASGIVATRDFWGIEVGVARRPGQRRERVTVAVGDAAGAVGVRVGAAVQFVLKPTARSGTSPYAGAGVTYAGARGARGAGYLAVMLGLEAAPGRTRGWYVELGLEGGVRLVAGLRWRRVSSAT